jgi:hypothetical protein
LGNQYFSECVAGAFEWFDGEEMKVDTLIELTNGDPIGYKNFPKMKMYLLRMPDYSSESKMKKLN